MSDAPVLFVIDDEPGMLSLIERAVSSTGYRTVLHSNPGEALTMLAHEGADAALVDLRMPDLGGLDVLRAIRQVQPACGVILMTAHASVDTAIEAVKLGALDYLTKPIDFDRLRQLLVDAREDAARRVELFISESTTAKRLELCGMIGRSPVMQQLFGLVRRIAPHARTTLIAGETGTGKEGIAHAIHDLGPRRTKRFATVNCSAVVETLFESELFGHVRGAFTGATDHKSGLFEAADGGTLFLDEVGELPPSVQAKLLRVLETGEVQRVGSLQPRKVDVRIVAATNRDLRVEVEAGRFRSDLFYRLNVVELHLPPLRERREDIPYLIAAFVKEFAARFGKRIDGVTPTAEQILISGAWLGNVRELRNVLERACMLAEGHVLTERDVVGVMPAVQDGAAPARAATAPSASQDLDQVEREHILRVLADMKGNKQAAARRLGISRRTLYRRLERHGLVDASSRSSLLSTDN
jgi:two-component system, NtrC family, response regulator HydG